MAVPAHIAARIAARKNETAKSDMIAAVVTGDGFPYPRISIRAGRYRLVEDGVETVVGTEMNVVIVGVNPRVSKIFYGRPYDPNATDARPDCFSHDGIKPDASIASPVHLNCASCPNNVLGSRINPTGAKSKLCADQRHLAVVPAADPSKIYGFTVPVSGMKGLREYFTHLQNYNMQPNDVVTELSFDANASFPRILFAQKGFVGENAVAKVDAIVASGEVKEITRAVPLGTYNKALAAPVAAPAISAPTTPAAPAAPVPAAQAAPAVDDAYEEEAPIPAAPEEASDLSNALAEIFK